eukprot:scaffold99302_cov39-Tisochrysis_lutea.AAC.1
MRRPFAEVERSEELGDGLLALAQVQRGRRELLCKLARGTRALYRAKAVKPLHIVHFALRRGDLVARPVGARDRPVAPDSALRLHILVVRRREETSRGRGGALTHTAFKQRPLEPVGGLIAAHLSTDPPLCLGPLPRAPILRITASATGRCRRRHHCTAAAEFLSL